MSAERHALVKEIFLAAREQPSAERAAFLAQRCAGDEELEREAEELEKIIDWLDGWKERRYRRTSDTSIIEQSPNVTVLRKPSFGSS